MLGCLSQFCFHSIMKTIIDILPHVNLINQKKSPIKDDEIERFLAEKPLNLIATTDGDMALRRDFVIISTPTDYDQKKLFRHIKR